MIYFLFIYYQTLSRQFYFKRVLPYKTLNVIVVPKQQRKDEPSKMSTMVLRIPSINLIQCVPIYRTTV